MTSIERTAYPRFSRAPSVKELRELYTPTPHDIAFVTTRARGDGPQFALMILLKTFQRLGYFPNPQEIPGAVISHIRAVMKFPDNLVPDIVSRTLYRYHAAIRTHLEIQSEGKYVRHVAAKAIYEAVQVMDTPADLINVAIETLVKEHCELPAFRTLDLLATRVRKLVNGRLFQTVLNRLDGTEERFLTQLIDRDAPGHFTAFNRMKEAPKSASLTHLEEWLDKLSWLVSLGNMDRVLKDIPYAKIKHLAAEAHALHATNLWDFTPPKRFTLLVCLIHHTTVSTRDEIVQMFLRRMNKFQDRAKEELELIRGRERAMTERLIDVFADVLQTTKDTPDDAEMGKGVRDVLDQSGGAASLLTQCEQVREHHGNRHQPFIWRYYSSHRKVLFRFLKTLDLRSTTQDQALMQAVAFILEHEQDPKKYLEASLDLSFANQDWQKTVQVRRKRKDWYIRQHLETCVFSYVAAELKSGDLCVRGSELFADYRDQLLSWEVCEPKVAEYCQQLGFPTTAEAFVEQLREWLTQAAASADQAFPDNHALTISEKGEPSLRKIRAKVRPRGMKRLEAALHARLPERHLLDILCRVDHWVNWSRHFGPLSGSEPKMDDAKARQILTVFAYGTNLGPHQMARHLRGDITAEILAQVNRRHITAEKLDAANRDIINRFRRCTLPRCWGDEKRAAADGTQYDLAEENLVSERHIRYGGFGGIAYHHISDMYIALFSHFLACSVFEAIYIIDGLLKNTSELRPDTVHADTQGQNLPVFALSHLLGIKLMPRIRNWKDLKFYRPSKETTYQHIDALFRDNVVDWELIKTHWQDLLRVVISIQEGKVLPSMLLRKLSNYSRKNRLYQAFRELGCVVRTVFLLQFLSDEKLREIIQSTTNKMEQFNAFCKWLLFGGEGKISDNTPEDQEKRIKYNDLIANCVILNNTVELSEKLNILAQEGYALTKDELAALSPYQTQHVKRFGHYELDLQTLP